MNTSFLMHMFIFDLDQPNIIYTAKECGDVSRVDLRVTGHQRLYRNRRQVVGSSVKALLQSPLLGANYLFVGGAGFDVDLFDIRLLPQQQQQQQQTNRRGSKNALASDSYAIKVYNPLFPSSCLKGELSAATMSHPASASTTFTRSSMNSRCREVSVSGMHLSKDGRTLLVNYQSDQIYTFDIFDQGIRRGSNNNPSSSGSGSNCYGDSFSSSYMDNEDDCFASPRLRDSDDDIASKYIGATGVYGGHFNYATFLKTVSFFGPNDEYIVSGCDNGYMWIWDTASGRLVNSHDSQLSSFFCVDPADKNVVRNLIPVVSSSTSVGTDSMISDDSVNWSSVWPKEKEEGEKMAVSPCRVLNVICADQRTCNGVVPHPTAPVLVSYGIDRTAKIWLPHLKPNDDDYLVKSMKMILDEISATRIKFAESFGPLLDVCADPSSVPQNMHIMEQSYSRFAELQPLLDQQKKLFNFYLKKMRSFADDPNHSYIISTNQSIEAYRKLCEEYVERFTNTQEILNQHLPYAITLPPLKVPTILNFPDLPVIIKPGQSPDPIESDYKFNLVAGTNADDQYFISHPPNCEEGSVYMAPFIFQDSIKKLRLRSGRTVFDHRQYHYLVSMIRKHINMSYSLPTRYKHLDEGPDYPTDIVTGFRIDSLPVHRILSDVFKVLQPTGFVLPPSTVITGESELTGELDQSTNIPSVSSGLDQQSSKRSRLGGLATDVEDSAMNQSPDHEHNISNGTSVIQNDPSVFDGPSQVLDDESWRILTLAEMYRLASKAKLIRQL